jgi:uncharacterized protein (DUF2235 family)
MALYAFNGTWNSEKTDVESTTADESMGNTNVVKFKAAYQGANGYYTNGVGTRFGFTGRFVGGAFGIGGLDRINDALDHLRKRLAAGDREIDIVGFSRGAALAIAFANRLTSKVSDPTTGKAPRIRFLGLWDLVGAFGIPINLGPIRFQEYNIGYKDDLPATVEYCFHALALDERRQTFRPTRIQGAYEVWFRGAHSDVGGGNDNLGLNNIALGWMLRKAAASGLPIDGARAQAAADGGKPQTKPRFAKDFIKNEHRKVLKTDLVHHTVAASNEPDCNNPPDGCKVEDAAAEVRAVRASTFKPA